jgi:hypothetical protein
LKDTFSSRCTTPAPPIGTGYRVVRFTPAARHPQNLILGLLVQQNGQGVVKVHPRGILQTGPHSFPLTDDLASAVYSVHPR